MINVTMDLNSAITGQKTTLCRIVVANDGTGTKTRGNYDYKIYNKAGHQFKIGKVLNWPRLAKSPIHLLLAVLNDAYPGAKDL